MHNVTQFIFPGAVLGSLILASFGYTVMASATNISVNSETEQIFQQKNTSNDDLADTSSDKGLSNTGKNSNCKVSDRYPENIRRWCEMITKHSIRNNLDPNLIAALIWQESGGNPTAYSKSGAVGLMQVMPRDGIAKSFMCANGPCFVNRPSIAELQKPNFNVKYGTNMLAGLMNKYGDTREALKYYGPMDVGYYYADKVLGIFNSNNQ
jgi:hypothetical protein